MKLKLMSCGFFFFSMVLCGSAMLNVQQDEDNKLAKLFDGMLEDEFKLRPMIATQLGDHRFDDRLENRGPVKVETEGKPTPRPGG